MERKFIAYMSYTRFDDDGEEGGITRLRAELSRAMRFLTGGGDIEIFQDVRDIPLGASIQQRIQQVLNEVFLLLPILTPGYFTSPWCREELELFLEQEQKLARHDLIIPLYYQSVPQLDAMLSQSGGIEKRFDPLIKELVSHSIVDWRPLHGKDFRDTEVRTTLEQIAQRIIAVVGDLKQTHGIHGISLAETVGQAGL